MAPKKVTFSSDDDAEEEVKVQHQTLEEGNSSSDSESEDEDQGQQSPEQPADDEQRTAVPSNKPYLSPTHSEEEDGSNCSSPSASGFMIIPAAKPSQTTNNMKKKKKKKPAAPPVVAAKVFSNEDEIALLRALALFWGDGEINNNWAAFHRFSKGELPHEFTKTQLSEKIRRLRQKFEKNVGRGGTGLSDPHESMVFELSEKLWGGKKMSIAAEKKKKKGIARKKRAGVETGGEKKKKKHRAEEVGTDGEKNDIAGKSGEDVEIDGEKKKHGDEEDGEKKTRKKQKHRAEEVEADGEKNDIAGKNGEEVEIDGEKKKMKKQKHGSEEIEIDGEKKDIAGKNGEEVKNDGEKKILDKLAVKEERKHFQSAYPLLCESFDQYPMFGREMAYLIGRENAKKLERRWVELKAEQLILEFKRIYLYMRDLEESSSE